MAETNTAEIRKPKKKKSGFAVFLLIWVIVLLVLIGVGLFIFRNFMVEYEASRPITAMTNYIAALDENDIRTAAQQYVAGLSYKVQSDDEIYSYLEDVFTGYTYAKSSSRSTEGNPVYVLQNNGIVFGEITLERGSEGSFGLIPWQVAGTEYKFDDLFRTATVTVPADYKVTFNGTTLGRANVSDSQVKYELLETFYGNRELPTLPYLTEYTYTYIGEDLLEVQDASGLNVPPENRNEDYYDNNCTAEEKAVIDEFTEGFVPCFVSFAANTDYNTWYNFNQLMEYVVSGGDMEERLRGAAGGLGFAYDQGNEVTSISVDRYMNLGGGYYAFEFTYLVDTTGYDGVVSVTNHMRLVVTQRDWGGYAAVSWDKF